MLDGSGWTQQAVLTGSDVTGGQRFGQSVALDGDTALVGTDANAAYLFVRSGSSWTQQAKLTAGGASGFGASVAVQGDTALVGAVYSGGVYEFERNGGTWTQKAQLQATDSANTIQFGSGMAIDGDTLVVGARAANVSGADLSGVAYVFVRNGANWDQQAKFWPSDPQAYVGFGLSGAVSLFGDTAIIGQNGNEAYVFVRNGTAWSQQAKLTSGDPQSQNFGISTAVFGETALIGAEGSNPDGVGGAGAAYLFTRSEGVWIKQERLTASDKTTTAYFGSSVAIDGTTGVVGARVAGAAYVFGLGQPDDVTAPIPVLSSLSPSEIVGGTGDFVLTLQGSDFNPTSTVLWNGNPLTTTFVSESTLTAQVPSGFVPTTDAVIAALVTVENPGVGESAPEAFTVKAANVGPVQTEVSEPGETIVAQVIPTTPNEPGVAASFSNQTPGSTPATVTAAIYTSNPVAGTTIDTGAGVVDLQITGADPSDTATVNFYYNSTVSLITEEDLILRFYDGAAWVPLLSSGGTSPLKNTANDLDGSVSGGRFTVIFDNTSTPRITELSGTFIAMAPNDAPTANPDAFMVGEGGVLSVSAPGVLANDTDPNNDALQAVLVNDPNHGSLALQANGAFTYTPLANYSGPDNFSYKANDTADDSEVAAVSITVTPITPVPGEAVSWWNGENNANDSLDGNNGTLENGATTAAGLVGQAFRLDGVDDYVRIPNAPNLNFGSTGDFTVEAWVKLNGAQPDFAGIFVKGELPYPGRWVQFVVVNNRLAAEIISGGLAFVGVNDGLIGTTSLNNGAWNHVSLVVTRSSQNAKLYVNGALEADVTNSVIGGDLSNSIDAVIGVSRDFSRYFKGDIDEVTLYNRALPQSELQAIVTAGSAGKVAPAPFLGDFVSWWKAEGDGEDSADGNNGTLQNGVTFVPGRAGQAFSLDGVDDYVNVPNAPNLNVGTGVDFSVEGWVKLNGTQPNFAGVLAKMEDGTVGHKGFQLILFENKLAAEFFNTSGFLGSGNGLIGTTDLADDRWHHVVLAVTRSSSNVKLYVDGAVEADVNHPAVSGDLSNGFSLIIGAERTLVAFFKGSLDELTLYNRALSSSEIQGIIAAGPAGKTPPPNVSPIAQCQDVIVSAGANCSANASIDNGSYDPDAGDTITLTQTPPGPYPIGETQVSLTVTDSYGVTDSCTATVTVVDDTPPVMVAQNITVILDASGNAEINAASIDNGSSDNCGVADVSLDITSFSCANVGSNPVTLTVTDVNGNSATASAFVTVSDIIAPIAVAQSITVQLDARGQATITPAQIDNGSRDACGIADLSVDLTELTCSNVGANPVVLTVTDNNGNSSTANAVVTVEDNVPPIAIAQEITVQLDAAGQATITPAQIDNGSSDNCEIETRTLDITSFTCANVGANPVVLTLTDVNGNSTTANAVVTVEDKVAPSAIAQNLTVQLDAFGQASISAAQIDNGSSDACGIDSLTLDVTAFTCSNVGANPVILTVTDVNGNISTANTVVTIEDNVPPIASAQDITVQLDVAGQATITPAQIDSGSSDNCAIESLTLDVTSFSCANVGLNTVTLTVTDVNGNSSTVTAEVTVEDNVPPVAVVQNIIIQLDADGNASITPTDIDNGSNDACGIASLSLDATAFTCSNVGANPVVLTVTDVNGNSTTANAVVTVEDKVAPIAIAQNLTVQLDALGQASISAAQIDNGSNDACGIDSLTLDVTAFTCSNVGANPVILTVTDVNRNSSMVTAEVTVEDNVPPATLVQNLTVQLDAEGNALITPADIDNGSNDACGIADLSLDITEFTCSNVGANPVVITVTDNNGNSATANAIVTVEDNVPPIALAKDITVQLDAAGNVSITAAQVDNGSNDACGIASLRLDVTAFACSNVGPNPIVLTVTDANGNASTANAVVTVEDNVTPVALAHDLTVQLDTYGVVAISAADIDAGSSDACGIANLSLDISSFTGADVGPNTVTLTATDVNGNAATAEATVTVEDIIPPVIAQPADITSDNDPGECSAVVEFEVASTDNSLPSTVAYTVPDGTVGNDGYSGSLGMDFDVNGPVILTRLGVFDSGSDGLSAPITAHVYDRNDSLDPLATLIFTPDNPGMLIGGSRFLDLAIPLALPAGFQGTIVAEGYDAGLELNGNLGIGSLSTATDDGGGLISFVGTSRFGFAGSFPEIDDSGPANRYAAGTFVFKPGASPNLTIVSDSPSGSAFPVGITQVTTTVTDFSGNTSVATFNVTVVDIEAPVVACKDITVQLDANGGVSITAANLDNGSTDNCGIASLEIDRAEFSCADVGFVPVTLTVTDIHGNAAICVAQVNVIDSVPPVVKTQDITVLLDSYGIATIVPAVIDNGSTDACGIASRSLDVTTFNCANVGPNVVTLTVTDVNGNSSQARATVTVIDLVPPLVLTKDITVQLDASGNVSIAPPDVDNGTIDACGIANRSLDVSSFTCANVGSNTVTLTVTDIHGNSASATAIVTVEDNVPPVALTKNITVQLNSAGHASITPGDADNGSNDACGIASLSVLPNGFTCAEVGDNVVTLTVTDNNGNVSTATATVTVEDNVAPVALVQDITVQLDAAGNVSITSGDVDNGSNDACGIAGLSVLPNGFTCAEVGDNVVTLTVTDNNGNVSTATATVTVEDNVAPVALAQDITVQLDAAGNATITAADIDNGSNDACGIASLSLDIMSFDCSNLGENVVTLTVADVNGNSSEAQSTVTVLDVTQPILVLNGAEEVTLFKGDTYVELGAAATDTCDPDVPVVIGGDTVNTGVIGVYVVTYDATDDSGNAAVQLIRTVKVLPRFAIADATFGSEELKLEEGAQITGSVGSQNKVELHKASAVAGNAFNVTGKVDLKEDVQVTGSVEAGGDVHLHKQAQVGSNVVSGQNVDLKQDTTVAGDVTAEGKVKLDKSATVDGTITENAVVTPLPDVPLPILDLSAGGPKVNVPKNGVETLPPGSYGKLEMKENSTLNLQAGVYDIESLKVDKGSVIAIDLSVGTLNLNITGDVDLKENVVMTAAGGGASDILIQVQGKHVKYGKSGTYLGTVLAPQAHIDVDEKASLVGALYGEKVQFKKEVILQAEPANDLLIQASLAWLDEEDDKKGKKGKKSLLPSLIHLNVPMIDIITTREGLPVLRITGKTGFKGELQICNDLVGDDWETLTDLEMTTEFIEFTDESAVNATVRFYRIINVEPLSQPQSSANEER